MRTKQSRDEPTVILVFTYRVVDRGVHWLPQPEERDVVDQLVVVVARVTDLPLHPPLLREMIDLLCRLVVVVDITYNGEDRLHLSVDVVFSYHGNIQHHVVVNTVASRHNPVRVEERGSTGRALAFPLESHHPGVLVHLAVLSTNHSLQRVPRPAL